MQPVVSGYFDAYRPYDSHVSRQAGSDAAKTKVFVEVDYNHLNAVLFYVLIQLHYHDRIEIAAYFKRQKLGIHLK